MQTLSKVHLTLDTGIKQVVLNYNDEIKTLGKRQDVSRYPWDEDIKKVVSYYTDDEMRKLSKMYLKTQMR